VTFEIDQNGSIALAFAPSPVVNLQNTGCRNRFGRSVSHKSQNSVAADWHSHFGECPSTSFTAKFQTGLALFGDQTISPPGIWNNNIRKLLCKGLAFAHRVITKETTNQ